MRQERRGYGQGRGQDEEAAGSLTGDKDQKSEVRSDQRSSTAKEKKGKKTSSEGPLQKDLVK